MERCAFMEDKNLRSTATFRPWLQPWPLWLFTSYVGTGLSEHCFAGIFDNKFRISVTETLSKQESYTVDLELMTGCGAFAVDWRMSATFRRKCVAKSSVVNDNDSFYPIDNSRLTLFHNDRLSPLQLASLFVQNILYFNCNNVPGTHGKLCGKLCVMSFSRDGVLHGHRDRWREDPCKQSIVVQQ